MSLSNATVTFLLLINSNRSLFFKSLILIKKPRSCRVSPGFEPADAGGSLPRNAALAQAYRVIPIKLRTLLVGIGSKREGNITNTEGLYFLYHIHQHWGSEKLISHIPCLQGFYGFRERTVKMESNHYFTSHDYRQVHRWAPVNRK
jgi:hypothetical protein